jgi:hypothetical protein
VSVVAAICARPIVWSGWGTAEAVGRGTAEANNCKPDCADGTFSPHPVTVTLTKPKTWGAEMAYSRLHYSVPSLRLQWTFATGLVPSARAPAPVASVASMTPPAAPSPVSTQATVSGSCVAGVNDITAGQFYSMSDLNSGSTTGSGDEIAEAYQLTLTDASPSSAAAVTGFAVVFYSGGQS